MIREYFAEWFRMLWAWIRPASYLDTLILVPPRRPLDWLGADDSWARTCERMRPGRPVDLVKDPIDAKMAIIWQRQRSQAKRERHDELGSWDPSTVNWSEPAIYRETALEAFRTGLFKGAVHKTSMLGIVDQAMDLAVSAHYGMVP